MLQLRSRVWYCWCIGTEDWSRERRTDASERRVNGVVVERYASGEP